MKYFDSLPFLANRDSDNNIYVTRNILVRTKMISQLAKNPLLFYQYALQDGDTPEIVANKYYGTSYRYWIVLQGNPNILDPQFDWPYSNQQFILYLKDKYAEAAGGADQVLSYINGTVHHYEKIITTVDNNTQTTAIKNVEIDEDTYNSLTQFSQTQSFADGSSVKYTVSKTAISIYDYENNLNESKRNINLINSAYASQVEEQYQSLVKY